MKTVLNTLFFLSMPLLSSAQMKVMVENPTDMQRQELIELSLNDVSKGLGIDAASPFVVKNAIGQEVDMQVTYDGKVLIDVAVQPGRQTVFTIEKGVPHNIIAHNVAAMEHAEGTWGAGRQWTSGRLYPDRMDDIAWENDRTVYRVYGPAFFREGNVGYGPDVWVKNTPELIVDRRYRSDIDIKPTQRQMEQAGYMEEAEKLVQDNSFHVDHGDGNDCYAVGPTLGCGAPCVIENGNAVYAKAWQEYHILDNGPLRFTLELVFADATYNGVRIREHRMYSLDKGSNFNRVEVWYESLFPKRDQPLPITVNVGFPLHEPNVDALVTGNDFMQYADPTDNPVANNCELYVACLFPDKDIKIMKKDNHAVAEVTVQADQHFVYYAGTAWSKYDVRNQNEWQERINTTLDAIKRPLMIHF